MTREQAEQRYRDKVARARSYVEMLEQQAEEARENLELLQAAKESTIAWYEALP